MFKGIANIASLLRNAQQMGSKMQEINQQLRQQRAVGNAGAGMVTVEVNGLGEVLSVTIDPLLVERGEREMIEDLVPAAVNQAIMKSKQLHIEAMKSLTGGVSLPGMDEVFEQLGGGEKNE